MDAVVFQMTDLLGEGKHAAAFAKLQQLLKMQQEPLSILGAVGAHFRRLGTAKSLLDAGKNISALMELCGMSEYIAKKTIEASRRFSLDFCRLSAELVAETDYKMKTSYDDPERLLELLMLQLAQEARRG